MLISLNWLKDFVAIPKSLAPEELAKELTMHTVEVEKIENQSQRFDKVVVGEILEIKRHPNADRLQIAIVNLGKEQATIVCGAPNIAVGQLVPVALVGAQLPNGIEIKESEIRGEKSQGMLCAEDELGLGDDHSGIMILSKAKPGQKFADYLNLNDIILEVDNKSLSNRPDLWGHYGLAREISAFLNTKLTPLDLDKIKLESEEKKSKKDKEAVGEQLNIKVEDTKACPRYMAIKVDGIEVADSPEWLQNRLIAVGLRPINNIVDITNYVMLEVGQPLHAFDAKIVEKIIVRHATPEEMITCLDGKERKLDTDMLVISNGPKPLAIAGIIGGEDSSINPQTTTIVIESANFAAANIRHTSTKLGVRTDASMRFEKALDPELTETALKLAIKLIKKVCKKAKITSALTDINYSGQELNLLELDLSWMAKLIGQELPKKRVVEILNSLGFDTAEEKDNVLNVKIPSWRATKDISIPEDLVEEVMRIVGYDNFASQIPTVSMATPITNESLIIERKIKNILAKENASSEVYNYSFVGEEELKKLNLDFSTYIKLANPISKQHTLLRQNLVAGLISNVKTNQYKYENINLFEVGTVYLNVAGNFPKEPNNEEKLPYQEKQVGIVIANENKDIFSQSKSLIANFLFSLIDQNLEINFLPTELSLGFSDRQEKAVINVLGRNLGTIARVDKNIAKNVGLKKEVVIAEFSFKELMNATLNHIEKKYLEMPKYPPVVRDLAFVVEQKILYNDLRKNIKNFHELIASVELFDVYIGDNLGTGKKSLAFHVVYQSPERTLTSEEVDRIQNDLINNLQTKFEAQIRDF